MNVAGLQNVWQTIMGFNLTAANKRWLADHLYEQAMREEALQPYTMEEIDARLDMAEEDVAAGLVYSKAEVSDMMNEYIQKHSQCDMEIIYYIDNDKIIIADLWDTRKEPMAQANITK